MIVLLIFFLLTPLAMAYYPCKASYGNSDILFRLATGSPGALGLLEDLAKAFSATHGTTVCWVKEALENLSNYYRQDRLMS